MDSTTPTNLEPVRPLLTRIEQEYHPAEVWLFGSRAHGSAGATSDWDLLVVVPDDANQDVFDPMRAWRAQKAAGVVADLVICTESDFDADRNTVNTIGYVVAKEGLRVFERGAAHRE